MRSAFSKALVAAAQANRKILLLTGDHGYALFDEFRRQVPEQFINAGIAEQNMVGVAAGLAKAGYKPVVYGLSAFVPVRVLEQIKLDVCYENLPVLFIGDGAGVVYSSLGSSHQSAEDIATLRPIPNIQILSPCDVYEMEYVMKHALQFTAPIYLRMGKSDAGDVHNKSFSLPIGDMMQAKSGESKQVVLLATGAMAKTAVALAKALGDYSVWTVPTIKPINEIQVRKLAREYNHIVVLEEHAIVGGLGGLIAEIVAEMDGIKARVMRIGVNDRFSDKCGSYAYLLKEHGLNVENLHDRIRAATM